MLVDAHLSAPHYPSSSHPHLLPMSHSFPARRLSPSPLCVLRFPVFSLTLDPVLSNIAAHRWGFASALGYPAGTVLRFRGIQGEIGPKKPDIAAHRPRRDAVWMEAQVLGADAGARVRGVWRRVEACGSAGKRHIGSGRGAAGMLRGARVRWRKALSPGNIGSIFTIDGKNNNSLGTVRRNSCQVVWHAGNLEVADNLPTPHAHT